MKRTVSPSPTAAPGAAVERPHPGCSTSRASGPSAGGRCWRDSAAWPVCGWPRRRKSPRCPGSPPSWPTACWNTSRADNDMEWTLCCSECRATADAAGLPTVCPSCGAPWLVRYPRWPEPGLKAELTRRPWSMWRYREWLPLREGEEPVSLGEGATPLLRAPHLERRLGVREIWVKDEGKNPTGSLKARGLAAAVTRARAGGATHLTLR